MVHRTVLNDGASSRAPVRTHFSVKRLHDVHSLTLRCGWLVELFGCWLAGMLVDWLYGWYFGWLVDSLVRWLIGKTTSIKAEVCQARTMHSESNPCFLCFAVWPYVCCAVGVVTF